MYMDGMQRWNRSWAEKNPQVILVTFIFTASLLTQYLRANGGARLASQILALLKDNPTFTDRDLPEPISPDQGLALLLHCNLSLVNIRFIEMNQTLGLRFSTSSRGFFLRKCVEVQVNHLNLLIKGLWWSF